MKVIKIKVGDEVCVLAQDLTSSSESGNHGKYFVADGVVGEIDKKANAQVLIKYSDHSADRTGKSTVRWGITGIYIKATL